MAINTASLKTLVVDDHQLSRKLLGLQLGVFGIKDVDFCVDGQEGLSRIKEKQYDIVLLDWAMPVIDGLEFLGKVKNDNQYSDTAFIMISAEAQSEKVVKALEAGAIAYIIKPINQEEINKKLTQVIKWLEEKNN